MQKIVLLALACALLALVPARSDAFPARSDAFPARSGFPFNAFAHRARGHPHAHMHEHPNRSRHAHRRAAGAGHGHGHSAPPTHKPANAAAARARPAHAAHAQTWEPPIDIAAEADAHVIRMAIPGVAARDIQLQLERDGDHQVLIMSGVRRDRRNRVAARFSRRVQGIPAMLTLDDLAATLVRGGELRVRVPRPPRETPSDVLVRERAVAAQEAARAERAHAAKWGEHVQIDDYVDWRDAWEHVPIQGLPTYEHH